MFLAPYQTETVTLVILDTHRIPSTLQLILMGSARSTALQMAGQILNDSCSSMPTEALPYSKRSTSSRPRAKMTAPRISRLSVMVLAAALILL